MGSERTFVIVGAGQAGGWTAKTLRDEGFDGRVVLIGEEAYPPYERPPLSKEVLLGEKPPESTYLWPADSYAEWNVELRLGVRVEAVAPGEHRLDLAGGETLGYDRLMLATGSRPRTLDVPGISLSGIHYLRAIPDTMAIRERIGAGRRVLVVGAGWIGLEVAAAARKLGSAVTVVEALGQLCPRALAADMAAYVQRYHEGQGVDVRLDAAVVRFEGSGSVEAAVLAGGETIAADLAVVGIGIVPNVELAAGAGLDVDNGVVVDEFGRTSNPDIFAAGDVTNHPNALIGRRLRLESWENAQNQAIAAAKSMLDKGEPYGEVPWFWSDQFDMNIQLVGLPVDWDETVMRGDMESGQFVLFYLKDGRIDGAAAVNNGRDVRFARRLMQAQRTVDPARLADPSVKLQALLKG